MVYCKTCEKDITGRLEYHAKDIHTNQKATVRGITVYRREEDKMFECSKCLASVFNTTSYQGIMHHLKRLHCADTEHVEKDKPGPYTKKRKRNSGGQFDTPYIVGTKDF